MISENQKNINMKNFKHRTQKRLVLRL